MWVLFVHLRLNQPKSSYTALFRVGHTWGHSHRAVWPLSGEIGWAQPWVRVNASKDKRRCSDVVLTMAQIMWFKICLVVVSDESSQEFFLTFFSNTCTPKLTASRPGAAPFTVPAVQLKTCLTNLFGSHISYLMKDSLDCQSVIEMNWMIT